jgi:hypothetical protein
VLVNDDKGDIAGRAAMAQQMRLEDGLLGSTLKDVQATLDAQPPPGPWYKFW